MKCAVTLLPTMYLILENAIDWEQCCNSMDNER